MQRPLRAIIHLQRTLVRHGWSRADSIIHARRSLIRLHGVIGQCMHNSDGVSTGLVTSLVSKFCCAGCGVRLQTRDQVAAGYIPSLKKLEQLDFQAEQAARLPAAEGRTGPGSRLTASNFTAHGAVCQRCFSAKHYGRLVPLTLPAAEYTAYLDALLKDSSGEGGTPGHLALFVVDLWDFHGGLLPDILGRLLRAGSPTLLVVNKVDLLPHTAPFSRVDAWVRRQMKLARLPPTALVGKGVHLVSAARNTGTAGLLADIRAHARGRDVFVAGAPNAGKSALVNALLTEAWGVELPWSSKPPPGPRPGDLQTALLMDNLPPGYSLGDAYRGDAAELAASVRGARPSPSAHRDGPVVRRGEGYGSSAHSHDLAQDAVYSAESAATLAREQQRKGRHRERKEVEEGEPASAPARSGPAPSVPFTVSPLPGTTLGVIGAALDRHGQVTLFDTPGIVGDNGLHTVLEGVALLAAGEAMQAQEERREKGGRRRVAVKSSTSALQLLVPSKRPRLVTFRLAPGRCMWLGGLARLEWSHPDPRQHILVTAVCRLPLHTSSSANALTLWDAHQHDTSEGLLWPRMGPLVTSARLALRDVAPPGAVLEPAVPVISNSTPFVEGFPRDGSPIGLSMAIQVMPMESSEGENEVEQMKGDGAESTTVKSWPGALMPGANRGAVEDRRRRRVRRALVDVVLRGLGWLALAPVEVQGQAGWASTVGSGVVTLHACEGVRVQLREPLLPHEASGVDGSTFVT